MGKEKGAPAHARCLSRGVDVQDYDGHAHKDLGLPLREELRSHRLRAEAHAEHPPLAVGGHGRLERGNLVRMREAVVRGGVHTNRD